MPEQPRPAGAVFLSYASQDAEAAKRICDTLRAAGVEVWFDQSELTGGDAWDAKIRGQISSCGLFVPVISVNTQARLEGYFRIEWKLAAQRTHAMAEAKAFLLPIVIDGTRDPDAHVPAEFRAVQWTRLPGGETPEKFCARVRALLSGDVGRDHRIPPPSPTAGSGDPAPQNNPRPAWVRYAWTGVGLAFALVYALRPLWQPARPTGPNPAKVTVAASPADELVAKARALIDDDPLVVRESYKSAVELCERATQLSPDDGEAWATLARANHRLATEYREDTEKRRAALRSQTERAIRLAPDSIEAGLAMAGYELSFEDNVAAARARLLRLVERAPTDRRLLRMLVSLEEDRGQDVREARRWTERANALPGGDAGTLLSLAWVHWGRNEFPQVREAVGKSLAIQPMTESCQLRLMLFNQSGDFEGARRFLREIPAAILREDRTAVIGYEVQLFSGDYEGALRTITAVPREFLEEGLFFASRGYLAGQALLLAGKPNAAKVEFGAALKALDERLLESPRNNRIAYQRAMVLARLGETAQAEKQFVVARELGPDDWMDSDTCVLLGRFDEALTNYARLIDRAKSRWPGHLRYLKYDPLLQPLRDTARGREIIARGNLWLAEMLRPGASDAPVAVPLPDDKSVAVLAFANLSDDKANEYFSDGISEELLNVLAKVPGLKVSARTSAFYFKGKEVPIPEIAQKLGVAYVVEGSVRKQGDKVRITAQLIKAADGFHVWSDTFTRDLKDIFAVQDEIAGLIAKNLELKMGITVARPTIDLESYEEYLAGRAAAAKASMADLREAVTHFERALAAEPKFTAAWVQLANAHTRLGRWGGTPTLQAWAAARAAIDQARALEPDSPDMLLVLGWILRTAEWDWRGAEQAFRRTLRLQPNQPDALTGAAVLLFNIGQKDEAFRLGLQATQLDPLNAATQIDLSLMFYFNGNWAEAEQSARRALRLAASGASYHAILAWSLIAQRRYAEAEAEIARDSSEIERATASGLLAIARGQGAAARESLAQLETLARIDADAADLQQSIAWISAGLGENDRAFAALEKARASRDPSLTWIGSSQALRPLRSDPRWPAFLRKIGLADDQLK